MNISSQYDIQKIVIDMEVALQIDATDYAEREYSKIIENVKNRIIRQYNVDLKDCKVTDDSVMIGRSAGSAVFWIENVSMLHGQLCGYLQIVRFNHEVTIRPSNVNYLGFDEDKLMTVLKLMTYSKTIPSIQTHCEAIKIAIGTISACMEKKLLLIMMVAHDLGFDEVMATIAEILYLGGKV